jgi:glycosyltransferase involved in cell wall biosynthesis
LNILLINHYAGAKGYGMEYRPFYLAREWINLGHNVTVFAASYSHLRTRAITVENGYKQENIEGINYIWFRTPAYSGNSMGRITNMLSFLKSLYSRSESVLKNNGPDAVIASSTYPLDIFPAHRISRKHKAKLIFEVHDLWPLSPIILGGYSRWHPYIMMMQKAEDFAYSKSDIVVSLLEKAQAYMESRGMQQRKFVWIPNGVDVEEWRNNAGILPEECEQELIRLRRENRFLICYAGAHGLANSLDTLIDAAELLKDKSAQVIFVGNGPHKDELKAKAIEKNLKNVSFWDPVAKESIPLLLGRMDALYIGLMKGPLFHFGISPNKLLDYMMSGKPVIQAIDAGNDMVSEAGCGFTVPPDNPSAVAQAIGSLMSLSKSELEEMGSRGRSYVTSLHDYRILARKFIDAMVNC